MEINIHLEVFPASEGDSFLVSFDKSHILIDAGVHDTYQNFIKQRLTDLSKDMGKLDLLVITHIDEDHIEGAIQFLSENGINNSPMIIPIEQVWHNSYRHLQFTKEKHIGESESEIIKAIISNGKRESEHLNNESKDISAKQGSTFASLLLSGGYSWNKSFQGKAVNVDTMQSIQFPKFKINLLSPNTKKLDRLARKWEKELYKKKYNFVFSEDKIFDDAFEFGLLMGSEVEEEVQKPISKSSDSFEKLLEDGDVDKSVTNGSSIAFILEIENKKMLFLGDSHSDIVVEQLEKMDKDQNGRINFDLVKISHHGSSKNTNTKLLELISSSKYVVSTDGSKHGHPDLSTLAKIVHQSKDKEISIYCNYQTVNSQLIEQICERPEYNCKVVYPDNGSFHKIDI